MSLHSPEIWSKLQSKMGIQDDMRIFMHPQQLVLVRSKCNKNRHVVNKKIINCAGPKPETDTASIWLASILALSKELHDEHWQGANPQLVLSNHFVRYALVPWNSSLSSQSERHGFLQHTFYLAFGETSRAWDLRISHNGIGRHGLASGIDAQFLEDIQHTFIEANFKLHVIYPHLMVGINFAMQQMERADYWFVLVEAGRACIALIRAGSWVSVKSFAVGIDVEQEIAAAIGRESIICGIDTTDWPLAVYWPGRLHKPTIDVDSRALVWIQPNHVLTRPLGKFDATCHEVYDAALWT